MSDKTRPKASDAGQAELLYVVLCIVLMAGLAVGGWFLIQGLQQDLRAPHGTVGSE